MPHDGTCLWLVCSAHAVIVLVGNKSDMSCKQREVSMVEGMRFARKHGLDFLEVRGLNSVECMLVIKVGRNNHGDIVALLYIPPLSSVLERVSMSNVHERDYAQRVGLDL